MCYILDNVFLTHETIHQAKKTAQPLVFLKLDFSKAYDWVDLRCLFAAMQVMSFPMDYINMVKLLFEGARARVCVNGSPTNFFQVNQGVRQGCLLAPHLFFIMGEVLNQCIK